MSLEENKAIVRRMIEAYNKHNLDWFDDFIAPDYFDHSNQVGRESVKQLFNMRARIILDYLSYFVY